MLNQNMRKKYLLHIIHEYEKEKTIEEVEKLDKGLSDVVYL